MTTSQVNLSRRKFIVSAATAGAGLLVATHLDILPSANAAAPHIWEPNAFVRIDQDNTVTVIIKHIEFGQGTFTGLATLVAEELDADWESVKCEHAPADASKYANLHWGKTQGTGGSSAIANSFMQMREAGATAKALLVAAAAQKWSVPTASINVNKGIVTHGPSGKKATFGELAALAAKQPVPAKVNLKTPQEFNLIGTKVTRKDLGKTNGTAIFTQDIQLPNQLTALVAHPPKFGAKLKSFDAKEALAVPGVVDVIKLNNGVAVLAQTFWQAKMGRDKLNVQWDESKAFDQSSEQLWSEYKALADKPGTLVKNDGNVDRAFAQASKIIEASYEFPYLAHAAMEPMNCVVQLTWAGKKVNRAELWYGCQGPTGDQGAVAGMLGISPSDVTINTVFAGGSFGRRTSKTADYVVEATEIAKNYGKSVPIKLVWTREDDTMGGYYRPMYFHKLKAGVDKNGRIIAWQHHIVGQSIFAGSPMAGMVQNGIDPSSVEGARELPYDISNHRLELTTVENPVTTLWWRSVGSTHTAHATECFVDEIAHAVGQDPLQYRLGMMGKDARHQGVLKLAAEKAQWPAAKSKPRPNVFYGVALHKSFGTYVAEVVETEKTAAGFKINKITCAVDCGVAVNPDIIVAQMEGGIGYGLSPAMMSKITFDQGKVVESNFHQYRVLRIGAMPKIDVHIVPSAEPPTGVGEPGTPVVGPALANAILAAGEPAQRSLPMAVPFA